MKHPFHSSQSYWWCHNPCPHSTTSFPPHTLAPECLKCDEFDPHPSRLHLHLHFRLLLLLRVVCPLHSNLRFEIRKKYLKKEVKSDVSKVSRSDRFTSRIFNGRCWGGQRWWRSSNHSGRLCDHIGNFHSWKKWRKIKGRRLWWWWWLGGSTKIQTRAISMRIKSPAPRPSNTWIDCGKQIGIDVFLFRSWRRWYFSFLFLGETSEKHKFTCELANIDRSEVK